MSRVAPCQVMAVVALLWAAPAWAQVGVSVSLEDAIARGVAHDPRLTEADARQAVADATVSARAALDHPMVTAVSGVLRTNHVDEFGIPQANGTTRIIFPDIPNNYRVRGELGVPLYTSGRVGALVASARADAQAVAADRKASVADVSLEVAIAYWTLVTSRERVGVVSRAVERADAMLSDVRARVDAGMLPPNEALTAQAQRARQRVQLIQAQNDAALAEAQLARLIGVAPGEPIRPTTGVDRPTPSAAALVTRSASELSSTASSTRPERQALLERQTALRHAAAASLAATRPQLTALAAVEPARPNQRFVPRVDQWNAGWDLGVNVTWSLWDGGRSRADRTATMAQADALTARVRQFDDLVALDIRQRILEINSTEAALEASAEAVAAATEARRVLGERFAAGVATSTDVLESDVAVLEAELERSRLQATLRVAEARLVRAAGGQ